MKRFFATIVFCAALLALLSYFLFPVTRAAENPIAALLELPAPPPPNPDLPRADTVIFPDDFFNKSKPPPDDAPIENLMAYWRQQAQEFRDIRYKVYPSDKVLDRILAEITKDPDKLTEFLNILPQGRRSAEFVKDMYDHTPAANENVGDRRYGLKRWLKYNTDYFSNELAREANRVQDTDGYVTNHRELVALARVDWDKASPIINRLYNNPGARASRTAALWALYLHAIETSPGDTDKYRDELKATVEDKSLPDGIRDLALDALSLEKEWGGRDDWYMTLLEDDTMLELGTYTGLTTLISASPDEKYVDRMIGLLDSDNITVRSAAARNLTMKLDTNRPEIVKALLPWLKNPKWVKESISGRDSVVQALSRVKLPEAVPLLILALDERNPNAGRRGVYASNAKIAGQSAVANAMNAAANAAATAANRAVGNADLRSDIVEDYDGPPQDPFPLRYGAITALANQQDPRAVPALRRILNETEPPYQQNNIVAAIYACDGFSIAEQVDAVEELAKNTSELSDGGMGYGANNAVANAYYPRSYGYLANTNSVRPPQPPDIRRLLGMHLSGQYVVKDELAQAVVNRIVALDRTDPKTSAAMRRIVKQWYAPAIYALLLQDLKRGRTDSDSLVRLLAARAGLREHLQSSLFDIRTGGPMAVGIAACLLEDTSAYDSILEGANDETKSAMLACARMIRAPLSVQKVAENLKSDNNLLKVAAERYLESEDSAEARAIVLSMHPGEAKILGATTAFFGNAAEVNTPFFSLMPLFASVTPSRVIGYGDYGSSQIVETEQRLQGELKKDPDLLGIYSWDQNFIHIYKDRALLSWIDDPARYRERALTKDEFDNFRGLIAHFKADQLPPYLACQACQGRELLMVGRNGGRRVYVRANALPQFFAELDRTFEDLRRTPGTIKYWAGKDIPGLEVLFADDRLEAKAVWKNGADFRLLTADKVRRTEIDKEIDEFAEQKADDGSDDEPADEYVDGPVEKERARREYENYTWSTFAGGALTGSTTQPLEVPFIPLKDSFEVPAEEGQWKARAGTLELRASDEGLFKLTAGKLTKILSGYYRSPVITPNGRWAVVTKYEEDDSGSKIVRVNLATGKEFTIERGDLPAYRAIVFVPSVNRVLVGPFSDEYGEYYDRGDSEDEEGSSDSRDRYAWLDPETGSLAPARGEVWPLAQQDWRQLQPAAGAFEFWAAKRKGADTVVGLYSTKNFTFKPLITLAKIGFESDDMWVDATQSKAYFVYEGHLLAVPLKVQR